MFLFDLLFRSFLPLPNPIGFGASDFIELALAALLLLLTLVRAETEPLVAQLALAALPVLLRLALWRMRRHQRRPGRTTSVTGCSLTRCGTFDWRVRRTPCANSSKPYSCCSSIFPLGQGLAMAAGWLVFGNPWAGVLLSVSALCALTYWMLRVWTTPGWALVSGLLAVMQFDVLSLGEHILGRRGVGNRRMSGLRKLEDQLWTGNGKPRILLVACIAGRGLALDMDTCVQMLDECGSLPTGPVGLVSLIGIPEGLNSGQTENFLRENGAALAPRRLDRGKRP